MSFRMLRVAAINYLATAVESLDVKLTNHHRFLVLSAVLTDGNGQNRHLATAVLGHSRQSLSTHELVPFS